MKLRLYRKVMRNLSVSPLLLAGGIGAVVRALVLASGLTFSADALFRYAPQANNLVAGHGFSRTAGPTYWPDYFDQPGYPTLVAGILSVLTYQRAVVVVQLGLELLTVLLAVRMAAALRLSRRAQRSTAGIGLLCPFLALWSGYLMTEVAAAFAAALTCYAYVCALRPGQKGRAPWWILAGLGSGACLLLRADTAACVALMLFAALGVALGQGVKPYRETANQRNESISFIGSLIGPAMVLCTIFLCLTPWMGRNLRYFGEPRPLGGSGGQISRGYVQWLDTWVDDTSFQQPYWWNALNSRGPRHFPTEKIPLRAERLRAMEALALAKHQWSFEGAPSEKFAALAQEARRTRPLTVWVVAPLHRVWATWVRAPDYAPLDSIRDLRRSIHQPVPTPRQTKVILLLRIGWLSLLGLSLLGLVRAVRVVKAPIWLPLALIGGRSVIPLLTAIGVESRYLVEALPACFLFGALGIEVVLATAALLWDAFRSKAQQWGDAVGVVAPQVMVARQRH